MFFVAVVESSAAAATYFVDPVSGNNARDGQSRENAWKTIPFAEQNAANGSTIYLMQGNHGPVVIDRNANSGRASWADAVTFKPEPGASPVIQSITFWRDVDRWIVWDSCTVVQTTTGVGTAAVEVTNGNYIKFLHCDLSGTMVMDGSGDYLRANCTDMIVKCGQYAGIGFSYIIFDDCDIHHAGVFGIDFTGPNNGHCEVKNSRIYHTGASSILCSGGELIHNNDIYSQMLAYADAGKTIPHHGSGIHLTNNLTVTNNRFYCVGNSSPIRGYQDAMDGAVALAGSWSSAGNILTAGEAVTQQATGAKGMVDPSRPPASGSTTIYICRATSENTFNASSPIVSDSNPGRAWNPTAITRVNPWGGYQNVTIENNLIVGGLNYQFVEIHDLGSGCRIVNNTFCGNRRAAIQSGYNHLGAFVVYPAPYHNGMASVKICSNIIAGNVSSLPVGCTARGNVMYAYDSGKTQAQLDAAWPGNKVFCWSPTQSTNIEQFTVGGNIFVGGGNFNDHAFDAWTLQADKTYVVSTWPLASIAHQYNLARDSLARGFADVDNYAETDYQGAARDADPDAGRHEYGASGAGASGPVFAPIGNKDATVGTLLTFAVTASDPNGDTLTYSASGLPQGATFSNRTFTWTPAAGQVGSHEVTFTVSDGQAQDSATITITVTTPNSRPVLAAIGSKSVNENASLSFPVSATDTDSQDMLTYSASGLPNGATFSGQTFTWRPGYNQAGSYQVTFAVSDGRDQDSEVVTISVANVNRTPAMSSISDRSVDTGNTLEFSITATDPDGDSLTYSAGGMPAGANLSGPNFTWTPTSSQTGSYDITFAASDGNLSASRTATIVVVAAKPDTTAPVIARCSPEPDSIQVPLNNLVTLHVTDAGTGVDTGTVVIRVNDQIVYQGSEAVYTSPYGRCGRSGSKNDYRYIYQPDQMAECDQTMVVKVNAADLQGNVMSEYSYSYVTEMQSFGANRALSTGTGSAAASRPVTVRDTAGNLWAAWHAGPLGSRDIYVAKLAPTAESFQTPVRLTADAQDQCNPDLATGPDGKVYVVWQDNRRGNWDIFASISSDRKNFSRETRISDSNDNETHPAIAVDGQSPNRAYVAWQDGRNGNQDIYVASSTNAFVSTDVSRVTSNAANQTEPDLTVGGQNTAYIVWTDMRNGQADIYAATSNAGPWTNVPVVTTSSSQTDPAVAAEPGGATLHLLWVDNAHGDRDIYYASSAGLPSSPVSGRNIVDDTSGADQVSPAITCAPSSRAFACWQDSRHAGAGNNDTDLYFTEVRSGVSRTNIRVGDDGTNAGQSEPAIGVNTHGHPYVVWSDDRDQPTQIYYAAGTFIDPNPLDSKLVAASVGAMIGTEPAAIDQPEDVSIIVPPGACQTDMRVTISRIINPQVQTLECLGSYDFGPSGVDFDQPVTVTIPYRYSSGDGRHALPYWYDSLTGALSQQGITDVENIVVSSDLNALRFKTTHFTAFYLVASNSETGSATVGAGSGDGGGGCSLSTTADGSPKELLVPYAAIATIMIILRRRDNRRRRLLQKIEE